MPTHFAAALLRKIALVERTSVLSAELVHIPDATSCAVIARLGECEIDEALELSHETEAERTLMRSRFRCGHVAFGGRVDGAMAFYAWVMLGEMEVGSLIFPIPPSFAYSYKVFTAPAFRHRGIASAYYAMLKRELPGQRRVLANVAAHNHASYEMHRACGFTKFGSTWQLRGADHAMASQSIRQLIDSESCAHDISWTGISA